MTFCHSLDYSPYTHSCPIISLFTNPLVIISVLVLSTFIGDISSALLMRCGTLYETSKSYAVFVLFPGLWNQFLNNVPNRSHPLVFLAHIIGGRSHYFDSQPAPRRQFWFCWTLSAPGCACQNHPPLSIVKRSRWIIIYINYYWDASVLIHSTSTTHCSCQHIEMLILCILKKISLPWRYFVGVKISLLINWFMKYYIIVHQLIIILNPRFTALIIMKMNRYNHCKDSCT